MNKKSVLLVVVLVAAVSAVFLARQAWNWHVKRERARVTAEAGALTERFFTITGDGTSLSEEAKTNLVAVLAEMDAILPECEGYCREDLLARRHDGAFLLGDYDAAAKFLSLLPDNGEEDRKGLAAKLRAHAAEDRGDWACAFSNYTIFVETTLAADPVKIEQIDPFTEVTWTKNGILAHNKKRLAGLAEKLGRAEEAERLKAEAKKFYEAAIAEATGDETTIKALKEDAAK